RFCGAFVRGRTGGMAGRDRVEYLLDIIGPPRKVEIGARGRMAEKFPLDTGRLRRVMSWRRKNRAGPTRSRPKATRWALPHTGAFTVTSPHSSKLKWTTRARWAFREWISPPTWERSSTRTA